MSGKNKADPKRIQKEEMTEEESRIDSLLYEDIRLTRKIERVKERLKAEVAVLRQSIKDKSAAFETELDALEKQKQQIRNWILDYWEQERLEESTVVFPAAMVSRRNRRKIVIHDRTAVLNSLDRIGRLDLVEYTFREHEVARLYAEGELKGLADDALRVIDRFNLQVRPQRSE